MPRGKPVTIKFKGHVGKGKRELHPLEFVEVTGPMLSVFRIEYTGRTVTVGQLFNKKQVPEQQKVPVRAYPLDDIQEVDFGYIDPIAAKEMMAKAKKEAEARAKPVTPDMVKSLKKGEAFPGEFDKKKYITTKEEKK